MISGRVGWISKSERIRVYTAESTHSRRDLCARVVSMLIPCRYGKFGEYPFAKRDEKRIAAKIVDYGDEE